MKKYLFVFLTTLFISASFAQKDPNVYDFFGGKTIGNKTVFYRLLFQINGDKVTGYAFTDEQGSKETKSIISGVFKAKTNTILFTETNKLITKSKQPFDSFCYLNGIVSFNLSKSISRIKGKFTESDINGTLCNKGAIEIISVDAYSKYKKEVELKKEVAIQKPKEEKMQEKIIVESVIPTFQSDEKITIKDDEEVTIFWKSDSFILDIWDDAIEDDDQITVQFNDEIILDKHILLHKKETLEFELEEGENKLIFTADNTGFIANNTARVDLFDDEIKHQIITKLKLNKSVTVLLVRY